MTIAFTENTLIEDHNLNLSVDSSIDDTYMYWTDQNNDRIIRFPINGDAASFITTTEVPALSGKFPNGICSEGNFLYTIIGRFTYPAELQLLRINKSDYTTSTVNIPYRGGGFDGEIQGFITSDGTYIYINDIQNARMSIFTITPFAYVSSTNVPQTEGFDNFIMRGKITVDSSGVPWALDQFTPNDGAGNYSIVLWNMNDTVTTKRIVVDRDPQLMNAVIMDDDIIIIAEQNYNRDGFEEYSISEVSTTTTFNAFWNEEVYSIVSTQTTGVGEQLVGSMLNKINNNLFALTKTYSGGI